jgi:hypothetical protein
VIYREFYAALDSPALPLFAMGLFVLLFLAMLLRTFAARRKSDYDPIAALPLQDRETSPELSPELSETRPEGRKDLREVTQ